MLQNFRLTLVFTYMSYFGVFNYVTAMLILIGCLDVWFYGLNVNLAEVSLFGKLWIWFPQRASCGPLGWGCRIHWLHLCRRVRLPQRASCDPVGWGCRIHWLHLCRKVRLPQRVSCDPVGCTYSVLTPLKRCCVFCSHYKIHLLHLCRGVRLSHRMSYDPVGCIYSKRNCLKLLSKWLNWPLNDPRRVNTPINKTATQRTKWLSHILTFIWYHPFRSNNNYI